MPIQQLVLRGALGLLLALAVGGAWSATSAQALQASYCGSSINDAYRCYESRTTAHTWNYDRSAASSYSADNCAYIAPNLDSSDGAIYGSGCAAGTYYNFCHTAVVNYYWAFVEHLNDSSYRTLDGYAETGKDCSTLATAASRRIHARAAASAAVLSASYSAFARPAAAADAAPGMVRGLAAAENASPNPAGVDVADARKVGTGRAIYAMPARRGACAALPIANGVATTLACTDDAHAGTVAAITRTDGGWTVWGAAEDAVRQVTVTFADGTDAVVPVAGNGFAADFAREPVTVTGS